MATSLSQILAKNQSRFQSITRKIILSHLTTTTTTAAAHLFQPHQLGETKPKDAIFDPSFSFGIYPSFSFQHFLNPVAPFAPDLGILSEAEDSNMIWADSVKKKRKRKMNKHKLKKQRKRLRRKTKK